MVQTGPNTQLGGFQLGLANVAYYVGMLGAVKIEPINPTACAITIEAIACIIFMLHF